AGIHAVDIHRLQARRRVIGHFGDLRPTLRFTRSIAHRRADRSHTGHGELRTIDHPALGTVRLGSDMRNTITPSRPAHTLRPDLRMLLDMVVCTDKSILQFHSMLSILQKVLSHSRSRREQANIFGTNLSLPGLQRVPSPLTGEG